MGRAAFAILCALCLGAPAVAEPVSFAIQYETEDGFTIHGDLTSSGSADGPVAILLHQYRSDRKSWAPLVPDLVAAGFTVLAIDQRGHGESRQQNGELVPIATMGRHDFAELVRAGPKDVAGALAYLAGHGISTERVVLIGASYGCTVALLSSDQPGVRGLVLLSPGARYFDVDVRTLARNYGGFLMSVASEGDEKAALSARTLKPRGASAVFQLLIVSGDGHGTRLFETHPEVESQVVAFALKAVAP